MLTGKCSFSIDFQLGSSHFVIQLFLSCAFSLILKSEDVSATKHLKQRGKNKTKLNVDNNMRTSSLCMKKDVRSVDERK